MNGGVLISISGKKRIISIIFLLFAATMLFSLVATPLVQAAKYGPIGSPGLSWRDNIVLNGRDAGQNPYPELISFTCNNPKTGKPFSNEAKETIREISNNSVTVFTGNFDAEATFGKINLGDDDEAFKNQPNYGMPGGPAGMQKYLGGETSMLKKRIFSEDIGNTNLGDIGGFFTDTFGQTLSVAGDATSGLVDTGQAGFNLVTGDLGGAISETGSALGNSPLASSARAWSEVYGGASSLLSNKKPTPKSAWTKFDKRSLNSKRKDATDHDGGFYVWAKAGGKTAYVDKDGNTENVWDEIGEYNATFKLSPEDGRIIANMINTKAQTPIQAFMGVPAGCPLPDWDTAENLGLSDLFNNLLGSLARLILAIPSMILDAIYGLVYPQAWKYAFYTPHTERGDTIFDMSTTCTPGAKSTSCKGYTELGYTTPRLDGADGKERPMYLKLTATIQWLLSGTYFLILFTSAVLFIFRGNRGQNLQLMRVGPRLALVLMFTFILPFLMGAVITLSNLTIMSILEFGSKGAGTNLAEANILSSQIGAWFSDDPNGLIYPVIKFVTGLAATIAATMVLASVYIRQLLLIILVVTAPIAVFCLIVDSWRPQFKRWLRVFLVVTLFPIILGLILKIGMFINPIFNIRSEKAAADFGQGDAVTAFVMLIIMFWAMARAVKMAQGMIGNPGGGAMGAAGGLLGQLGQGLRGSKLAPLGMMLGAGAYGLGRASQAPTDMKAALVPGGRGSMGAGGGMFAGGAGGMGPGGGAPGLPGGKMMNGLNEKFARFAENGKTRKAQRQKIRQESREAWRAGDKKLLGFIPSPRSAPRAVSSHILNNVPKGMLGLDQRGQANTLRGKLFQGMHNRAQGHMNILSDGEAQNIINQRMQEEQRLVSLGLNRREVNSRLNDMYGSAPKMRGGKWKQFVTAENHEKEKKKMMFDSIAAHHRAETGQNIRRAFNKPGGDTLMAEHLSQFDYGYTSKTEMAQRLGVDPDKLGQFVATPEGKAAFDQLNEQLKEEHGGNHFTFDEVENFIPSKSY